MAKITLTPEQVNDFSRADDFHIAPYRADGRTPGTPTWIWSVVVDGELYVRAWNGLQSRWYGSAKSQGAGEITIAGQTYRVAFELISGAGYEQLQAAIDTAYQTKYADSAYMPPMLGAGPREATVHVILKEQGA